jgi:hypothetical protein
MLALGTQTKSNNINNNKAQTAIQECKPTQQK